MAPLFCLLLYDARHEHTSFYCAITTGILSGIYGMARLHRVTKLGQFFFFLGCTAYFLSRRAALGIVDFRLYAVKRRYGYVGAGRVIHGGALAPHLEIVRLRVGGDRERFTVMCGNIRGKAAIALIAISGNIYRRLRDICTRGRGDWRLVLPSRWRWG